MGRLPEPDDVDFVVEGGDSDPDSIRETIEFIEEYKRRPEHAAEVLEAKKVLEALEANSKGDMTPDPAELLAHWQRTAEELKRKGLNGGFESPISHEVNEGR